MNSNESTIDHICEFYFNDLMCRQNVIGVGKGYKIVNNKVTCILSLLIFVTKKYHIDDLDTDDIIPSHFLGIPTDIIEILK